jgi:folate-binding protein YgfZ
VTDALRTALEARGATFGSEDGGPPTTFGDPAAEFAALGGDVLDLLNRLSTNEIHGLAAGEARPTVLTSPKGRVVARLWCHHLGDPGLVLLGDSGTAAGIIAHLDRYTFAEDTRLSDAGDRFATFAVRGPRAPDAAAALVGSSPAADVTRTAEIDGRPVHVLGHDLLGGPGFTILAPAAEGPAVLDAIDAAVRSIGGAPAGDLAVEPWRIANGLPRAGAELDEEYNPLEAGLRDAVHFSKGCYVGQEVVARLETYDKVSRRLMVVRPTAASTTTPARGDTLTRDGRAVGAITSAAGVPGGQGWLALAYVKRSRGVHGGEVDIDGHGPAMTLDPPVDPQA